MALPTVDSILGSSPPPGSGLPSVDSVLGKPSVDDILGPAKESTLTKVGKFVTGGKDEVDPATGQPRLTIARLGTGVAEDFVEGGKNVVPGLRAAKVLDAAFFRDSPDENLVAWHQTGGNPSSHLVDKYVSEGVAYPQAIRQAGIEFSQQMQQGYKGAEASLEKSFPEDPAFKGKTSGTIESGLRGVAGSIPGMAVTAMNAPAGIAVLSAQQAGQTFKEAEAQGSDPERAAKGAWTSALIQAPVEYLGNLVQLKTLGNALKKSPMGLRVLDLAKSGVAEGIENLLQGIPEDIADFWIKNPDKTLGDAVNAAAQDPDKFQRSWDRFKQGVVGGIALTGTGQAVGAGVRKITGQNQQASPVQPAQPSPADSLNAVGDTQDAYAAKVARAEYGDGSTFKNPDSSASGLYQFVDKTWAGLVNSPEGKAAGLTMDGRADQNQQNAAMSIFTARNRESLTKSLGRAPNDSELYTAHFLGAAGAKDFLGALESTPGEPAVNHVTPEAARANAGIFLNKDGSTRTVAEVAGILGKKVGGDVPPVAPGAPAELRSLRNDIQGREVQQRALEEQGVTLPAREAQRLGDVPALPAGQGFEMVGSPQGVETMLWKDMIPLAKEMGIPSPAKMTRDSLRRAIIEQRARTGEVDPTQMPGAASQTWLTDQIKNARAEAGDNVTSAVWGRIDPSSVDARTGQALKDKFGPGIFAQSGKGAAWDQLQGELPSLGVRLPETQGGQPLLDYLLDRGVSKKQAVAARIAEAKVEAARMGTGMSGGDFSNRKQFRPEDAYDGDVPFSSRGSGQGIRPEHVHGAVNKLQVILPKAMPTDIVKSPQELPQHIRDTAQRQGHDLSQVEGVYDKATGRVHLVADNLRSPERAAEVWLHEQIAHHGLRELFGADPRFKNILENVRKDYRLSDRREAEEMIARLAEKLNAGEVLKGKDAFSWSKVVDFVRSWLVKSGLSTSRENVEAMLRQSLRNLAKGEAGQGERGERGRVAGAEAAFSLKGVKLSDYQEERLSQGARLKDFDIKRTFGISRMLFIDRFAPAMDLVGKVMGKGGAREFDKQVRRQGGGQGIVHDMLSANGSGVAEYGIQGSEMNIIPGSKTLGMVLDRITGDFQRYVDFNSFMVARREVGLSERNDKTIARINQIQQELPGVSKDIRTEADPSRRAKLVQLEKALRAESADLRARQVHNVDAVKARGELSRLKNEYGATEIAQFEQMHKGVVKWLDQAVLKPRLDAGLLSREAYSAIVNSPEHEGYAAYQREIEHDGVVTVGGSGGPKRIKGSDKKIIMPIESALAAVVRTVQEVEQAKTNQLLVDIRNVNPDVAEAITPAKAPGRGTITTFHNGVAKYWSVPWEVAAGMNGLSPEAAKIIRYVGNGTLLRPSAQALRMGTTVFSFAFSIRNILRDQIHAVAMSGHGYNPAKFVKGFVEYLKDATGKDSQAMRLWRRSGGETGMYTAMEQSMVKTTVADMLGFHQRTAAGEAVRWAASPFQAIRWIGEAGETATRVALHKNVMDKGGSASDAMLESRDTTVDFSRAGLAGQVINQIIPFWNANVQGLSKMARTIKERPGKFALNVLLGITAPSILEWAAYHDEDWWKKLEAWEKDMFWHFKAGGTTIRIPKPFEVGVLFGSLPVRILEWWDTNDANGMWKVGKAIKDGMTPPLSNPLITPLLENYTNHSFFSDRPLESRSMENLQPWMRYNQTTSELSKSLGKLTDISPIKFDNWIRGQLGTVGRDVTKALDVPINAMRGKDSPPSASKPWYEMTPGLSGFVSRTPEGSRSEPVNDFYVNMERATQAAATRSALVEAGNTADLTKTGDKDVFFAPSFKKASAELSGLRKDIAAVNESMSMEPDAKRARIDELERKMTSTAQEINEAYNRDQPAAAHLFYGVKAQVNAAKDAYDEAQKAGRKDDAARILKESGIQGLYSLVKSTSSNLAQIEKYRSALDENTRVSPAARDKYLAQLDKREAEALQRFKTQSQRVGAGR